MAQRVNIGGDCPNCGAVWGLEEMEWQKCFGCGYPDSNDEDLEDFGEDDDIELPYEQIS